jgi:ABC-type phosphate transport system substrate-binding protein
MRSLLLGSLLALAFAAATARADDGFVVIVHSSNGVGALTKAQASELFLKKTTKWSGGEGVQPVDLKATSPTREKFSQAVHGKSAAAISTYWSRLVFSGRETSPPEKASDDEVIAFVKANPGAVGYVAAGASTAGVKVVTLN